MQKLAEKNSKGFLQTLKFKFSHQMGNCIDIYYQGILRLLKEAAPHAKGKLLDVGCGRKPHLDLFSQYVTEYIGIEKSSTFKLTQDSADSHADYYYNDNTLHFNNDSFDTVVSFSVLEHTPEPWLLFSEMTRILKVDGLMIQHVPFSFRLHEEPHDYYRFSSYALQDLCEKNGLAVQKILPQGSLWSTLCHKILTFLIFRFLRLSSIAQSINKLGMEAKIRDCPRYWLVPFTLPFIFLILGLTHILEKFSPVEGDPLAFLLIAKKL